MINSRSLQTQQRGQRKIIGHIFGEYFEASRTPRRYSRSSVLPVEFFEVLERERSEHRMKFSDDEIRARVVADFISRMTDEGALRMYQRLSGNEPGSIFDQMG